MCTNEGSLHTPEGEDLHGGRGRDESIDPFATHERTPVSATANSDRTTDAFPQSRAVLPDGDSPARSGLQTDDRLQRTDHDRSRDSTFDHSDTLASYQSTLKQGLVEATFSDQSIPMIQQRYPHQPTDQCHKHILEGEVDPSNTLRFEMELEEDVGAAVEDLIMYSRLGLVDDALAVIHEVLWRHLLFFPALAEVSLFLIEQDEMEQLETILTLIRRQKADCSDSLSFDERAFVEILDTILPPEGSSLKSLRDLPIERQDQLFRSSFYSSWANRNPTQIQIGQIGITLRSMLSHSLEEYMVVATRVFDQLVEGKLAWEATYVFKSTCSGFQSLPRVTLFPIVPSLHRMYKRLMYLVDEQNCPRISDMDPDEHAPELICCMVAKASFAQALNAVEDMPSEQQVTLPQEHEIPQLQATAKQILLLLLQLLPDATSRGVYANSLGLAADALDGNSVHTKHSYPVRSHGGDIEDDETVGITSIPHAISANPRNLVEQGQIDHAGRTQESKTMARDNRSIDHEAAFNVDLRKDDQLLSPGLVEANAGEVLLMHTSLRARDADSVEALDIFSIKEGYLRLAQTTATSDQSSITHHWQIVCRRVFLSPLYAVTPDKAASIIWKPTTSDDTAQELSFTASTDARKFQAFITAFDVVYDESAFVRARKKTGLFDGQGRNIAQGGHIQIWIHRSPSTKANMMSTNLKSRDDGSEITNSSTRSVVSTNTSSSMRTGTRFTSVRSEDRIFVLKEPVPGQIIILTEMDEQKRVITIPITEHTQLAPDKCRCNVRNSNCQEVVVESGKSKIKIRTSQGWNVAVFGQPDHEDLNQVDEERVKYVSLQFESVEARRRFEKTMVTVCMVIRNRVDAYQRDSLMTIR